MEKHNVTVTPSADRDLSGTFEYTTIYLNEPAIASKLVTKLCEAMFPRSSMPHRFALVKDDFLAKQGFRTMLIDNYIIFYVADESAKKVIIHRVLYAKHNYPALFVRD